MLVEELMTTDIVTCDFDASLREAVERMVRHRTGSVIVTRDDAPFGIVTETDALEAGAATDRPFSGIPIEDVVSRPLVTTTGKSTVRKAVNRMNEEEIKKLPVVDGVDLLGIVTHTDIVLHYEQFIKEAHALSRQRGRWE